MPAVSSDIEGTIRPIVFKSEIEYVLSGLNRKKFLELLLIHFECPFPFSFDLEVALFLSVEERGLLLESSFRLLLENVSLLQLGRKLLVLCHYT